ncbi:hypothetical protein H5410_010136 [Solanum commersonii]|uniref:Uncharacterized protein n=1 Tax=Solanum commersonii TaxID=4109 RepID=A0A9J6AJW7_SOLCO|nr:hypothetical protein H5410_010136 [Solanum commersonii]
MKSIRQCGILQNCSRLLGSGQNRNNNKTTLIQRTTNDMVFHIQVILMANVIVYLATLSGTYVPDWNFVVQNPDNIDFGKTLTVTCNVRENLDHPCNAMGYINIQVLG